MVRTSFQCGRRYSHIVLPDFGADSGGAQTAVSDLPNSTNSPLFMLVTDVAGFDQIRPGIPKGLNPL